jgi:uncharacterized membrane protein HdeD (DUF308 family)
MAAPGRHWTAPSLLLGLLVLAQWPVSGLWVIGLFIGIDLIFYGCAWIALALACVQLEKTRFARIETSRPGCEAAR